MHIKTNSSCPLCRASLKTITICKYENDQFDRNQIDPATVAIRLKYEKQMYICTHVAASSSYEELMTLICDLLYLSADHVKLIHKNKKLNPSSYSPSMLVPPRSKKNTKTEKDAGKLPLFLLVGLHAGKQKHRGGYDSDDSVSAESYCVTC